MKLLISIDALGNEILKKHLNMMPNLKMLIEEGVTFEDVVGTYPTATWSLHTSIITGTRPIKHGIVSNRVYDSRLKKNKTIYGDYETSVADIQVETLWDLLNNKGYEIGAVCYPLTTGSSSIKYNIPEYYDQALYKRHLGKTQIWQELEKKLSLDHYGDWGKTYSQCLKKDALSNEIASYLLEEKKMDFLAIHYLGPDSFMHQYGVASQELKGALVHTDKMVGDLIGSLKGLGLYEETTFIVLSDHGQVDLAGELFNIVPFLNAHGLYDEEQVHLTQGGCYFIYDDNSDRIDLIKALLEKVKKVEAVFCEKDYKGLGLPTSHENPQSPQLIVEMKKGEMANSGQIDSPIYQDMSSHPRRIMGMHGYLHTMPEMKPFVIIKGPNIKNNYRGKSMELIDVAPTIAAMFSLELKTSEGKVQNEIFKKENN